MVDLFHDSADIPQKVIGYDLPDEGAILMESEEDVANQPSYHVSPLDVCVLRLEDLDHVVKDILFKPRCVVCIKSTIIVVELLDCFKPLMVREASELQAAFIDQFVFLVECEFIYCLHGILLRPYCSSPDFQSLLDGLSTKFDSKCLSPVLE